MRRILVVEDNLAIAKVIGWNLQIAEFQVSVAHSGQEACAMANSESFDLIVTDYQMPIMDGLELCRRLRRTQKYAETPIILVTAKRCENDELDQWEDIGVAITFEKPFSPKRLISAVNDLISTSQAAR